MATNPLDKQREYSSRYYYEHREKVRASHIERRMANLETYRRKAREYNNKRRVLKPVDPERRKARNLVTYAVKCGRLRKPTTCPECLTPNVPARRMHAHHYNGYNNPLDVVFLCSLCHFAQHRTFHKPELKTLPPEVRL